MTVLGLTALFWRRGGGRHRAVLGLAAAGVAASVVLALLVLSVDPALGARADRIAWRDPAKNLAATRDWEPTALQHTSTDQIDGKQIARVDLALAAGEEPTIGRPPGMARFPRPGEIFVSPAMDAMLRSTPADRLADRYPGTVAGTIGPDGLAFADELVVVIGHDPAPLPAPPAADSASYPPGTEPDGITTTPTAAIASVPGGEASPIGTFVHVGSDHDLDAYRTLSKMAAVLLVIPTLLLLGAAARLTAAHREQRMAVLRLAGAVPGTVVGLTAIEVALAGLLGALVGVVGYLAALPLAARIPLAGGTFSADDLRLGAETLVATVLLVPLLTAGCAVVALRKVSIGPLGVTRRRTPRRPSLLRFLVVPAAWFIFFSSVMTMRDGGSSAGALIGLGAVIATLAALGPWAAWVVGWVMTKVARRPAVLIAARRIRADPAGSYRTVSGMVLAGLIAGFLFGVLPTMHASEVPGSARSQLNVEFSGSKTAEVLASLDRVGAASLLDELDSTTGSESSRTGNETGDMSSRRHGAVLVGSSASTDEVRTAITGADPSASIESWDGDGRVTLLLDDLGRASVVMALAALAMATVSTAISGTASILDQRVTLARLRLVGTSIGVLQRARRWQTLVPLLLAGTGAMVSGAGAGLGMMVAFDVGRDQIVMPDLGRMVLLTAASVVAGIAVVACTRPVLVATSRANPRD